MDAGRMEPLPAFVSAFAIATKLGRPVDELEAVHPFWIRAAEVMLEAEQITRDAEEQRRKAR